MASISKAGNRYKVRWRVGGQARSQTFETHAAALAFRTEVEGDLLTGRAVTDNRVRLSTWAETWLANRQGLRASTTVRNASLFTNHVLPALGDVYLADLTAPRVQAFVTSLTTKPVSRTKAGGTVRFLAPTTIREVYQELHKCLTAAVQAKYLRDNPCQGITLPKVEHAEMHFLNHGEIRDLAEAIDARYLALVYLLAYGGLRVGEASALLPQDYSGKGVTISKTTSEIQGKMVTNAPKTRAGRRTVPLPKFVCDTITHHQETHPGPFLFTGRDGGQIRSNAFRARQFTKARTAIGRPELRIHDLRHTAVSLWIAQGVDLLRIKKWAGHESATFTLDRYGHLFEDDNEAVLLRLNQGIESGQGR